MQIEFISLTYRIKTPSDIDQAELQRQLALMAARDCANLGALIEQTTAMLAEGELPADVRPESLLRGYHTLGRLLGGIADQAIAAIEDLGEILEEGPRGAGLAFESGEQEIDIDSETRALATELLAARGAAA